MLREAVFRVGRPLSQEQTPELPCFMLAYKHLYPGVSSSEMERTPESILTEYKLQYTSRT